MIASQRKPPPELEYSGKKLYELNTYDILKKRRLSKSVQKQYSNDIELDDYYDSTVKLYFKLFRDEDVGINENVQKELVNLMNNDCQEDDDIESDEENILLGIKKTKKDLVETGKLINFLFAL